MILYKIVNIYVAIFQNKIAAIVLIYFDMRTKDICNTIEEFAPLCFTRRLG